MASKWIQHVAAFRKAHPGMDPKKVFGEAAKTFKKQSTKQSGGLAALSPEPVSGMPVSSGTGLQLLATTYSGGKKRSAKRGAKRGGNKRSTKRSAKRSAKRSTQRSGGGTFAEYPGY